MQETAEALAAPDPELARERGERAAARSAEARGDFGRPMPEADHQAALAGFLAAGLARPPAWSDSGSVPPPGAWCSCCDPFRRSGSRWWRETVNPTGWRCWTCHPPVHLAPGEMTEMRT